MPLGGHINLVGEDISCEVIGILIPCQYVFRSDSVGIIQSICYRVTLRASTDGGSDCHVREAAGKSGKVAGGLSGVLPWSIPVAKSIRFSRALATKGEEGITIDLLHKLNQKNVSAWNIKRLTNMVRHGVLSTLDEQISGANQNEEDEIALQIRSENQAKIAAKIIFINVAKQGSRHVHIFPLFEAITD